MKRKKIVKQAALGTAALSLGVIIAGTAAANGNRPVDIEVLAPEGGHRVGVDGRGWFVDLEIGFDDTTLDQTGFGLQITGPSTEKDESGNPVPLAGHIPGPFQGGFSPGADDRLPGLIVLVSTFKPLAGSCQNLANLFNLTGVTNVSDDGVEIWDTWIIGKDIFRAGAAGGEGVRSKLYVAMADDLDGDGIYNDAPPVVPDVNGDGKCNKRDLKAVGLASRVEKVNFHINGPGDTL